MAYKVVTSVRVERDLECLHPRVREGVLRKLEWLSVNAEKVQHSRLQRMPSELAGICKMRVADYRVFYFVSHEEQTISVLRVQHRSEAYRDL